MISLFQLDKAKRLGGEPTPRLAHRLLSTRADLVVAAASCDQALHDLAQVQGNLHDLVRANADLRSRFEQHVAVAQRRSDRHHAELALARTKIATLKDQLSVAAASLQRANSARDRAITNRHTARKCQLGSPECLTDPWLSLICCSGPGFWRSSRDRSPGGHCGLSASRSSLYTVTQAGK
jgi:hypothetical protein